ncbi:FAD-dependent oxidoreductase, partial [Propionibacterium freudenreichii]|nr:FAD-dependent oxidoreductase [Propionibacterium freudenreichii]
MAKHVIVIGAGVVGLACAWRLRRRGHRVTLLDPSPASGASHAAAGMLAA